MKHKVVKFEDALKELNWKQFFQLCNIFGIRWVEKVDESGQIDLKNIKVRRDFEKLTEELCAKYYGYNRKARRQMDRIIAKIRWGNARYKEAVDKTIGDIYAAGVENLDSVMADMEADMKADMAAEPSEECADAIADM